MKNSEIKRLDLLLLELGLATTRTKAQELISGGKVSVDGKVVDHPGAKFAADARIELSEEEHPYVSRGGVKLAAALVQFQVQVNEKRVFDIGQSTGGFTDCLLRAGAAEVFGIDVGSGQLAAGLRTSPKVKFLEKTDVRSLAPEQAGAPFPLFVADLSFISLSLVLPSITRFLAPFAEGIVLVKPQFELSPGEIGSGGIVRGTALRDKALKRVKQAAETAGFTVAGSMMAPVQGGDGNQEFFLHLRWLSQGNAN